MYIQISAPLLNYFVIIETLLNLIYNIKINPHKVVEKIK